MSCLFLGHFWLFYGLRTIILKPTKNQWADIQKLGISGCLRGHESDPESRSVIDLSPSHRGRRRFQAFLYGLQLAVSGPKTATRRFHIHISRSFRPKSPVSGLFAGQRCAPKWKQAIRRLRSGGGYGLPGGWVESGFSLTPLPSGRSVLSLSRRTDGVEPGLLYLLAWVPSRPRPVSFRALFPASGPLAMCLFRGHYLRKRPVG